MGEISPKTAALLARDIYTIQSSLPIAIQEFLKSSPVFSQKAGDSAHLKAEVGFRLLNTKDGFGVFARGGKGYENDLFLMFRGTTTANLCADIVSDLRAGVETSKTGLPVHIGFNSIFCSMLVGIQEFLNKHKDATGTIHILGHSLGGAVAAIAADWISVSKANPVKLYTFGAPKPGLEFFAGRLTNNLRPQNIYRVYHATDVVPMVPVYPFAHSPVNDCAYQMPSDSFVSVSAHRMANYIKSVGDSSWLSLKKSGSQLADERSIKHWLQSRESANPANPKTWEWINSGLALVLRHVIGGAAVFYQARFVVGLSLADKISWILLKGIDLSADASGWVLCLMRKIMQALGMKVVSSVKELTQIFMRRILQQLMQRMSAEAVRALRGLLGK